MRCLGFRVLLLSFTVLWGGGGLIDVYRLLATRIMLVVAFFLEGGGARGIST